MRGAWRPILLAGALCAVCAAWVAIAIAAPSRARGGSTATAGDSHRSATVARRCHRAEHRRCHKSGSRASRHKPKAHRRSAHPHSQPLTAGAGNQGQGATPNGSLPETSSPGAPSGAGSSGGGIPTQSGSLDSPPPPAPTHVEITAEDEEGFRFVLSRSKVPAGKTILEFVNHGQDEHNLNAAEGSEGEVVGSLPNTPANAHLSLTVDLKPGSYTLFCSLPGHAAKGMKGTLTVE